MGGAGGGLGSAPVVLISRSALLHNARIVAERGGVADLRRDAWGHGLALVAAVADEVGLVDGRDPSDVDALTLYGLPGGDAAAHPAMTLVGSILSVKTLRAGEGVSYGYTHRASTDTRIALVAGGYAQGVVRSLGNTADVLLAGARHPIVGRVAMDACVVEIGDAPVARADQVLFFGDPMQGRPSIGEWASHTGLSVGELVTMVGLRARREVTG